MGNEAAGIEPSRTVRDLIAARCRENPAAIAVVAEGRRPLSYTRLLAQIDAVAVALNGGGIGRNDPVALVLPQGPEAGLAAVAVAAVATAAPLNPLYREAEFDFVLTDLGVRALIVERGSNSPALAVARRRDIPIIELIPSLEEEAGIFSLAVAAAPPASQPGPASATDVALVLHTSGTTGRPKVVPLTQSNLVHSTRNMIAACRFTPADRGLAVLPQFHIAIMSTAVVPFCSGGSVVCPPRFDPARLAQLLEEFRPTWYAGVPVIHQAVRGRIARSPTVFARHPFRFVSTGGAAMPADAIDDLEQALGAPVLGVYGLTEGAGLSTCNPLPPRERKSGSVGVAAGQDVAIMDEHGSILEVGRSGEVVIRGANVMAGYRDDPRATRDAFHGEWLRTGDLGHLDEDGHLWLSGRAKELINRGGEKILPLEVDRVLLTHPAVAQAVAFALPDERLGEVVAAAVVLRPDASATESELRAHAAEHLAHFKVPRPLLIVDDLPRGPTGKVPRVGLGERLGLTRAPKDEATYVAPRTAVEVSLARLFAEVLEIERVGVDDDFFALGGDSLLAVTLFNRIEEEFERAIPVLALFERGTVAELARELSRQERRSVGTLLVPIRAEGVGPPFVCVHGMWGDVFHLRRLARFMGADIPFYGLRIRGLDGREPLLATVDEMAEAYVDELVAFDPEGPYMLGGFSFGGVVAFEMAYRLTARGRQVALLALIDTISPAVGRIEPSLRNLRFAWNAARRAGRKWLEPAWVLRQIRLRTRRGPEPAGGEVASMSARSEARLRRIEDALEIAARRYRPPLYPGRVTLLRSQDHVHRSGDPHLGWGGAARGGIETIDVAGVHAQLLEPPYAGQIAADLERVIARARKERM